MQSISHLKYCLQQNFIFENFILRKFCQIYLIFQKKKKFESHCSHLTGQRYCSRITVYGLLFIDYCWSQYKNCIVTHFQQPLFCLAIQFLLKPSYCNTLFQLPSLAIHSCILQYNFLSSPSSHNTILPAIQYSLPACNTILYCNST